MQIIKLSGTNEQDIINQTISTLKDGGLVVFPTDTVYGLLADATNPIAIDKLLAFKERPTGKAISIFVSDKNMAEEYVISNSNITNITKNLLPGPFTIVCNSRLKSRGYKGRPCEAKIDKRLLAENGTLGFRIPDYPLILELVRQFGKPLTATSANISSTPPHYSVESLLKSLGQTHRSAPTIDLIIDAGKLPFNKPSTVIDTTSGELKTLRFGDLLPNTPNSLISRSEEESRKLAGFILSKSLKNSLSKPVVFLLQGELGTGKTIFTKGLAEAVAIKETVVSPTYTLCYEYRIPNTVETRHAASLQRQSTNIPHLSTGSPIINDSLFDTERPNHNINYVEHICKNDQLPMTNYQKMSNSKNLKIGNLLDIGHSSLDISPRLIHYDLYRIESPEDLKEIRFLESIKSGNLYSIEWPERIDEETLSKLKEISQIVYIKIKHVDENTREFSWGN